MRQSEYNAHVALAKAAGYAPQVARNQAAAVIRAERQRASAKARDRLAAIACCIIGLALAVSFAGSI